MIRKLTIKKRLYLVFTVIVMCFVLLGGYFLHEIRKSQNISRLIYKHPLAVSNAVRDIQSDIIAMHRSMKDVALSNTKEELQDAEKNVDYLELRVLRNFDLVYERFLGDLSDVDTAFHTFVNWRNIRKEVFTYRYNEDIKAAAEITKGQGAQHVNYMLTQIQEMVDFAGNKADEFYTDSIQSAKRLSVFLMILLALIVILLIVVVSYLTNFITKPIQELTDYSKKVLDGNYSQSIKSKYDDEFGLLVETFNSMVQNIQTELKVQSNVAKISSHLIEKKDFQSYSKQLVNNYIELLNADIASFYYLNESKKIFNCEYSIGMSHELINGFEAEHLPADFEKAIRTKDIVVLNNIAENSPFIYRLFIGNIVPGQLVIIPLLVDDKVLAIIALAKIKAFKEEELKSLEKTWFNLNASFSELIANERIRKLASDLSEINVGLEKQKEELNIQRVELQKTSEELQEQNIELEKQRKQVVVANNLKNEFLSNMSHELRTPLNSILALSRVLITQSKNKLSQDEITYLEVIERNGRHLLSLINDVLDISKIESGKMDLIPEYVSIEMLLDNLYDGFQPIIKEKGIKLIFDVAKDVPKIETDVTKLIQILQNLISNAIKFTEKGYVRVVAKTIKDKVEIIVEDTGIGIHKKALSYVFEEFRQEDGSTSRKYGGTGLGLSIVKKLVNVMGGVIFAESEVGIGSKFYVKLPITWFDPIVNRISKKIKDESTDLNELKATIKAEENAKKKHETAPKPIEIANEKNNAAKYKILIVEDNPDNMLTIKAILKDNYDLAEAIDGEIALRKIVATKPDLILLDMSLPKMDGIEIVHILRNNEEMKNIKVIAVTANTKAEDKLLYLNQGCDEFVPKPINANELIQKINNLLTIKSL